MLDPHDELLQDFIQELKEYRSPQTARNYHYILLRFGEYINELGVHYGNFERIHLQYYINSLTTSGKSASTVNTEFNAIKTILRYQKRTEVARDIRVVKPPSTKNIAPKSLRPIEQRKLFHDIEQDTLRNQAIVLTLIGTGVRVEELTNIDRSDVIILDDEGELIVRHGKGNKERSLPINKMVRDILMEYLCSRKDKNPALFIGRYNRRLGVRGVQYVLKSYGLHPHRLRHTYITNLVRNNDLVIAQTLSGHSSIEMLSRYAKPSKEDLQQAVEHLYQ